jgi:purine-nucleoside phosphorylase
MNKIERSLQEAEAFLKERIPFTPEVGIILGTGLSDFVQDLAVETTIPYGDIPHFPVSTVESHAGNMLFGLWKNQKVIVLQGRVHYYEGYSLQDVVFPVRLLKRVGASTIIVTNAAGGLDPAFSPGELMVIKDHVNLIGDNPLRGANVESLGERFPSMNDPYCRELIKRIESCAKEMDITLHKGVYVAVAGPSLETAAETRFLRMIGADAVGMSTVPEVIAAVHAGMKVLGIAVISNVNIPESLAPAPLEEVVANVQKAGPSLVKLIGRFLEAL